MNTKLKDYLHLHVIVFIWGFTAVLGKLITIAALPLVWYRMLIAVVLVFIFVLYKKTTLRTTRKNLITMIICGVLIAVHWVTFFYAIKTSTVSTTLVTMSSSAFFVVLIKPFFERKKFEFYELILASITIIGFIIIFRRVISFSSGSYTYTNSLYKDSISNCKGKCINGAKSNC